MVLYTTTRKKVLRLVTIALTLLIGIAIGIAAILTAVKGSAYEKKVPIYCVDRGDNKIALTFDCAWGNSNTEELIAILSKESVPATFFVTGEFCDNYPDDVKKFFDAGGEIANHSDKHPHVKGINVNDLIADTKECSRKIEMLTGTKPTLYRSPYGEYDDKLLTTIEGMKLTPIQWSVDSIDWQSPSSDTIIKRMGSVTSGSILLFHNDLANTTEALPQIIASLKESGYTFVSVSELIYKDNYHIDNAGKQIFDIKVDKEEVLVHPMSLLSSDDDEAVFAYSDNKYVNQAAEIMRQNLTLNEIYSLTGGVKLWLVEKVTALLNAKQIAAIQSLSYDELKEVIGKLIAVAEKQGAAALTTASETTAAVTIATTAATSTSPQEDTSWAKRYDTEEEQKDGTTAPVLDEPKDGTTAYFDEPKDGTTATVATTYGEVLIK